MSTIHPSAIVCAGAFLEQDVTVGPFAVIGAGVRICAGAVIATGVVIESSSTSRAAPLLAKRVSIGPYTCIHGDVQIAEDSMVGGHCTLHGSVTLGATCRVFDGVIVGGPGQFPGREPSGGGIEIGDLCVLREGTIVLMPVLTSRTSIGKASYLMARTHVDHDCRLGQDVKTATGVTLGGSVEIGDHAYLGMNAVVHQNTVVGAHAMIGMNGVVMRHVPPYATLVERRFRKINRRGLIKHGYKEEAIRAIELYYQNGLDVGGESAWSEPITRFFARIGDAAFEPYSVGT